MKKRGFTLVEMLAVISLMGVLMLLIVPSTASIIKKNKQKNYEIQIKNIEKAANNWLSKNGGEQDVYYVTLEQLKAEKLIDKDIIDPRDNKFISNDLFIKLRVGEEPHIFMDSYSTSDESQDDYDDKELLINNLDTIAEFDKDTKMSTRLIELENVLKPVFENIIPEKYGLKRHLENDERRLTDKVFVKIHDLLYLIISNDDNAVYALYYANCETGTCVRDSILGDNTYYGFGTNNPVVTWGSSSNQLKDDMDIWYYDKRLSDYIVSLPVMKSYDIESDGLTINEDISDAVEEYSFLSPYESYIGMILSGFLANFADFENSTFIGSTVAYKKNNNNVLEQVEYTFPIDLNYCQISDCEKSQYIPLINLKPTIKITSGKGTENKPYILEP